MNKTDLKQVVSGFLLVMALAAIFSIFADKCNAQTLGEWRWSHQEFMDAPKENVQHLGTGLISFTLDQTTSLKWWQSDLIAIGCGIVWECKDAVVPWEKIGYWGAEGYSWMDVRTDIAGVAINRILNYSIKTIYRRVKK